MARCRPCVLTSLLVLFLILTLLSTCIIHGSHGGDSAVTRLEQMPEPAAAPQIEASTLRQLTSSKLAPGEQYSATVICIPELRRRQAPCTWLDAYISQPSSEKLQVFEYQYTWADPNVAVWPGLIVRSDQLLNLLRDHADRLGISNRPLVFVGHGLGGLVLKKAVTTLFERHYDSTYSSIHNLLSAIVLLGTPHLDESRRDNWATLSTILAYYFKLDRQNVIKSERSGATAAKISRSFEESVRDIPVLSVFESRPTKINKGFFTKRRLLVGKDLSKTAVDQEIMVLSSADHDGVCDLEPGSEAYNQFAAMIESVSQRCPNLQSGSIPNSLRHPISIPLASSGSSVVEITPDGSDSFSSSLVAESIAAIDISRRNAKPRLPCYLINSEQGLFIGRADVFQELDNALLPPLPENSRSPEGMLAQIRLSESETTGLGIQYDQRPAIRVFALCGIGGLGKTQTALQYALSRKKRFDAVFWIPAETEASLDEAFSVAATSLHLVSQEEGKDSIASRNAVLSWLSRPLKEPKDDLDGEDTVNGEYANWLLVFDNVIDVSLLRQYIPNGGPGSVLVTSRDPLAKSFYSPNAGMDLKGLDEHSAEILLHKLTYENKVEEDDTSSKALVRRLDYLPIAILHAAGVINGQDLTFKEFLERYERDIGIRGEEIGRLAKMQAGSYAQTLGTVWALESLKEQPRTLFNIISLLDNRSIQESLLKHKLSDITLTTHPLSEDYVDVRSKLSRSYLITRDKHAKNILCHNVPQDVARQLMEPDVFKETFAVAVTLLGLEWGELKQKFGHLASDWRISDKMVPHVMKLSKHFENHRPGMKERIRLSFATLLARGAAHLSERANWDDSLYLAELALSELEKDHTGAEAEEQYADILFSLSSTHACLGNAELNLRYAQAHFKQRLMVVDADGPDGDPVFRALAYTELSLARLLSNEFEEAIRLAQHGRELQDPLEEFINGISYPHWAVFHISWGLIGLGRAEEARPMLMDLFSWRERRYGIDSTESFKTAYALQILGIINEKSGRLDEAVKLWERSLLLYSRTEGDSSVRTNQVRVKLGEYYGLLGMPESARAMFDAALKYFHGEKYFKAERARTLFKKSEFLARMSEAEDAARTAREAEEWYYKARPEKAKLQDGDRSLTLRDFDEIVMIMSR